MDGLKTYIQISTEELTKAEVAKSHAEKEVVKLTAAVDNNAVALEEAEAEHEKMAAVLDEVEKEVQAYKKSVKAAHDAAEESSEALAQIKAQVQEQEELTQAFRKEEV